MGAPVATLAAQERVLNVPPDVYDLRDRIYSPSLRVPPDVVDPREHVGAADILNQGDEGACTGFALAAVVNHLFRVVGKSVSVSPRFLYENARRYDEWEGQEYEGSSIRGAMKGFLKHGACSDTVLPYRPGQVIDRLPDTAYNDARSKPLGAYYRVTTSSVNDLQGALSDVGAVLVSAQVHAGWQKLRSSSGGSLPRIDWAPGTYILGGHAFAIVGYTSEGFIVQNSWGRGWGDEGFAILTYTDWLANRMDAWVGQLGIGKVDDQIPLNLSSTPDPSRIVAGIDQDTIRGHYLAINNGVLDTHDQYPSFPSDIQDIAGRIQNAAVGNKLKVLLFAHGGLVGEDGAAEKTAKFVQRFMPKGIYPLHFIWHTDFMQEVEDLILGKGATQQQPVGGFLGGLTEKLQDALDGGLEVVARPLGEPVWGEMKRDADVACHGVGSAVGPAMQLLDAVRATGVQVQYHLVGHSAGSIFHCQLMDWFDSRNVEVRSMTFWAPAVSTELFCQKAQLAIGGRVRQFSLHTMADIDERDDHCGNISHAGIYHKSLLYLVSYSFEEGSTRRILGLDRHIHQDKDGHTDDVDPRLGGWITSPANCDLVFRKPNLATPDATLHGSFDDDEPTIAALEQAIVNA